MIFSVHKSQLTAIARPSILKNDCSYHVGVRENEVLYYFDILISNRELVSCLLKHLSFKHVLHSLKLH